MTLSDTCAACTGRGGAGCACRCGTCGGSKTIQKICTNCSGASRVTCRSCSGSGRVLKKKSFLFGETYGTCESCQGSREVVCRVCEGKGNKTEPCDRCQRTGSDPNCPKCQGKGKVPCSDCRGKGVVAAVASADRIRDEIERRNDEIAQLEEAIEFHREQEQLRPQDGFQGRDLETKVYELRLEIGDLRSMLR